MVNSIGDSGLADDFHEKAFCGDGRRRFVPIGQGRIWRSISSAAFLKIAKFNPAFSGAELWMHARGLACEVRKGSRFRPLSKGGGFFYATPSNDSSSISINNKRRISRTIRSHRFREMQGIENLRFEPC